MRPHCLQACCACSLPTRDHDHHPPMAATLFFKTEAHSQEAEARARAITTTKRCPFFVYMRSPRRDVVGRALHLDQFAPCRLFPLPMAPMSFHIFYSTLRRNPRYLSSEGTFNPKLIYSPLERRSTRPRSSCLHLMLCSCSILGSLIS